MSVIETGVRLTLKNILLLTDFSEPSELAVPFATAIAREYESKLYAMHVLTPLEFAYATPESAAAAIERLEEGAQEGMQRLDAQLHTRGVSRHLLDHRSNFQGFGRAREREN